MTDLALPPQALKADWRSAESNPYRRIPVLEKRALFTKAFRELAERLALRKRILRHFERQQRDNWSNKPSTLR